MSRNRRRGAHRASRFLLWAGVAVLWAGAGLRLASAGDEPEPADEAETPAGEAAPAPAMRDPEAAGRSGDEPWVVSVGGGEIPASRREVTPPGPFPLPEDLPDKARFVVIELHTDVTPGMASFVERVIGGLGGGDILVLDINTFGGRVDAAVRIRDALLGVRERGAHTVAYVHPRAISAGALISLATDVIAVSPGASIGAATPIEIGADGEGKAVGEKVVSYMRTEMRSTAEARGRSGDIAEAMVDADREVDGLSDQGKLLTLDGKQALAWSIASFEADTFADLVDELGYGEGNKPFTVANEQWSWAERIAAFLTGPMMSGLLMTVGMLGIMVGLYTGGHPLLLTIGGVCLSLFFFGHHIVNLAGFEEILLFALGVALIIVEVSVPGHVVPGVIGILLVIASLLLGLVSFEEVPFTVQWEQGAITRALATVFGSIFATSVLTYAAFRVLPDSRLGRRLVLSSAIAGDGAPGAVSGATGPVVDRLVGARGVAASDLRPSGVVQIGGRRLDAVAERGVVARGAEVVVVGERGFSVVVAAVASKPAAGAKPAQVGPAEPGDGSAEPGETTDTDGAGDGAGRQEPA